MALSLSIAHWEDNLTSKSPSFDSEHCALCQLCGAKCNGCPLAKYAFEHFGWCHGTPYYDVKNSYYIHDYYTYKIHCQAMIDLLKKERDEVLAAAVPIEKEL